jgi:ribose transport system substrate-binding protein
MKITRWMLVLLATLVLLVFAAGCGGDDEAADEEPVPAETGEAAEEPAEEERTEPFEIAYLSASSANTWLLSSKEAMDKIAQERNANITEFDAEFNAERQVSQLQDVIASGQYDGIVITAIDPGIIPDVERAIDEGMEVAVLNQILGNEFDTADPQVEGVAVSVLAPPLRSGERLGELAVRACEDKDPCRVVYFYGIRGIPLDIAMKQGFDSVVGGHDNIEIVAEGEGQYLGPDHAMNEMQDIMQRTPEFDVVVGSDQAIQGVQQALEQTGRLDQVAIMGLGGSQAAIDAIREGNWFGGVFGAPYTEGELAFNALLDVLEGEEGPIGIDPLTHEAIPDEGLVTQDNVDQFEPQWAG